MKLERIVWRKKKGKKILHFFSNTSQFVELEYGILFLAYSVLLMWTNKAIILLVSQAKLKTILRPGLLNSEITGMCDHVELDLLIWKRRKLYVSLGILQYIIT